MSWDFLKTSRDNETITLIMNLLQVLRLKNQSTVPLIPLPLYCKPCSVFLDIFSAINSGRGTRQSYANNSSLVHTVYVCQYRDALVHLVANVALTANTTALRTYRVAPVGVGEGTTSNQIRQAWANLDNVGGGEDCGGAHYLSGRSAHGDAAQEGQESDTPPNIDGEVAGGVLDR